MIESCNFIDLSLNRKGDQLVIGWANDLMIIMVPYYYTTT